jgi:hypothetical protein
MIFAHPMRVFALAGGLVGAGCIPDVGVPTPTATLACDASLTWSLAAAFAPCDPGICGPDPEAAQHGRCVDESAVEPASQRAQLARCADGTLCVPVGILVSQGLSVPATCRSVAGLEGRCSSRCLPAIASQAAILPQDVCAPHELCAPCYDPATGLESGACSTSVCDAPSEPPPDLCALDYEAHPLIDPEDFEPCSRALCADGRAHCLPTALLPSAQAAQLSDCDAARKCVPDAILRSGGNAPARACRTFAGRAEGRCQSLCIPGVAAQAGVLDRDVCASDELCAPCYDPLSGASTGACEGLCDEPSAPPYRFTPCCEGRGACVARGAVPADQRDQLQSCTDGGGELCVPVELAADPDYTFPPCTDATGQPGACVSTCLDAAATFGEPNAQCGPDARCVPCMLDVGWLSWFVGRIETGVCPP